MQQWVSQCSKNKCRQRVDNLYPPPHTPPHPRPPVPPTLLPPALGGGPSPPRTPRGHTACRGVGGGGGGGVEEGMRWAWRVPRRGACSTTWCGVVCEVPDVVWCVVCAGCACRGVSQRGGRGRKGCMCACGVLCPPPSPLVQGQQGVQAVAVAQQQQPHAPPPPRVVTVRGLARGRGERGPWGRGKEVGQIRDQVKGREVGKVGDVRRRSVPGKTQGQQGRSGQRWRVDRGESVRVRV